MRLKLLVLGIAVLIGVTLAWTPSPSCEQHESAT